jgi:predicted transcriptional regulator
MSREKIDRSEAILRTKRNTRRGLQIRNIILKLLYDESDRSHSTREIVDKIGYTYSVINYHLKNMLFEQVVEKEIIQRRNRWKITGLGQQTIKKYLDET